MQPYLFPYIGYFQLLDGVDEFVVYDNIQYTKKGWINRNRILLNGKEHLFTVPLKNDSDYLDVRERCLSDNAPKEINKILNQIKSSYSKAPYYKDIFPVVEGIFLHTDTNLFGFIFHSIVQIRDLLGIRTKLHVSSELNIDHALRGQDKVIEICRNLQATTYINPIGGIDLYAREEFAQKGIALKFHRIKDIQYSQGTAVFEKSLSIIDVLMFNGVEKVKSLLNEYILE